MTPQETIANIHAHGYRVCNLFELNCIGKNGWRCNLMWKKKDKQIGYRYADAPTLDEALKEALATALADPEQPSLEPEAPLKPVKVKAAKADTAEVKPFDPFA